MSGLPRFLNKSYYFSNKYARQFHTIPYMVQNWSTSYMRKDRALYARRRVKILHVKHSDDRLFAIQKLSGCMRMRIHTPHKPRRKVRHSRPYRLK